MRSGSFAHGGAFHAAVEGCKIQEAKRELPPLQNTSNIGGRASGRMEDVNCTFSLPALWLMNGEQ